ncbi:MAG TPA: response regulator [Isosphaeraceae bacterium]|nr:response regulator [Isosphaeraceae bacterium]
MEVTVLIVSDDPAVRHLLRATIGQLADKVVLLEAEDATSALRLIAGRSVDLAIVDLFQTDYSGVELSRQIQTGAARAPVPVILLTEGEEPSTAMLRSAGIAAALPKPFSPRQLLEIVQRLRPGRSDGGPEPSVPASPARYSPGRLSALAGRLMS